MSFLQHIRLCILCSSFPLGGPSENARWTPPGIYPRMLRWTPVAPFPRPVLQLTPFDFLAGTPSVAVPRQGRGCARPTSTASYDSRCVTYRKYLDEKEGEIGGTSCMNACMCGNRGSHTLSRVRAGPTVCRSAAPHASTGGSCSGPCHVVRACAAPRTC